MHSDIFSLPTAYLDKQITLTFFKKASFPYFCSSEYDYVLRCAYKNIYIGFGFKKMSILVLEQLKKKLSKVWNKAHLTEWGQNWFCWRVQNTKLLLPSEASGLLLGDRRQSTWRMCQSENSDDCTLIENEGLQLSLITEAVKCSIVLICWRWMGG